MKYELLDDLTGVTWKCRVTLDDQTSFIVLFEGVVGNVLCLTPAIVRQAGAAGTSKIIDWLLTKFDAFIAERTKEIEAIHSEWAAKYYEELGRNRQPEKESRRPKRRGFVYLLAADGIRSDSGNRLYKIGCTTNLSNRLDLFEVKLPFPIHLVHAIETNAMDDAERILHTRFASKRKNGEWFELSDEDLSEIKDITRLDV